MRVKLTQEKYDSIPALLEQGLDRTRIAASRCAGAGDERHVATCRWQMPSWI
jgi:hypothetical protein